MACIGSLTNCESPYLSDILLSRPFPHKNILYAAPLSRVIYDIFTCHGRSNHWWHFFPPILQPCSKYFIRSVPDLRLRHLAADQKKRPILFLHRQPLEHDTWRLVRCWWVFQRRTTVTARAVIFPKLAPISSPIDLPRSCRYSNICIPFISWIVVISLKLKPAAKIATLVWVVTQHYIRGRADCYPCLTATLVWDCHLCLRLPPLFEIATLVWDCHLCLRLPPLSEIATFVWDCHLCLRLPPLFEIATFV